MNSPSIIQNLRDLKTKLDSRQMSVLVGAGFGKNIDDMFPSWWELLYDMAFFLTGKEIEENYENASVKKRGIKKNYVDEKINDFIEKTGYLDLVTEFIKRKGFEEAVTAYIEEQTPRVIYKGGKRYLTNIVRGKKNEIELTDSMLGLHTSLINLPWNNIYTTNYDEMLELSNDMASEEKLKLIQHELEQKNKDFNERLTLLYPKLEHEEEELISFEEKEMTSIGNSDTHSADIEIRSSESIIQNIRNEVGRIQDDIKRIEKFLKQNNRELIKVKREIEKCLKTITHSSDLAIKRNKNIIKLHGTIRNENDDYGFDSDSRSHYIISREDYTNYPKKHEAFTQLMRISLLQESYCLIGFSGVDPNFLEWIKWVRDILERNKGKEKAYKIYLIDVDKVKINNEKQLFYENFRICRIPLDEEEVIQFLEKESGEKLDLKKDRKKALLTLLLSYLNEENLDSPNLFIQQHLVSNYKNEWGSIRTTNLHLKSTEEILVVADEILQYYDTIIRDKDCIRIKQLDYGFTHNKRYLVDFGIKLLQCLEQNKTKQKKLRDLVLISLEELMIPIYEIWKQEEIEFFESLLKSEKDKNKFYSLKLRAALLYNDEATFVSLINKLDSKLDFVKYEKILWYAFSLNFKKLKSELTEWNPNDAEYMLKKAGFLALFDTQFAKDYLLSIKSSFGSHNVQELVFYYELMLYFNNQSFTFSDDIGKILKTNIGAIESKGFNGISKYVDEILDDIKGEGMNIDRYGADRFSQLDGVAERDLSNIRNSVDLIQLLLALGVPLSVERKTFKFAKDWYHVCKNIYEKFPIPCLYYSLQYTDEKVVRRIGQDFSYSETLTEFNNKYLPRLLGDYLTSSLPLSFKKAILYFTSEIFISVNPTLWEGKFLQIWKKIDFQKRAFDFR